MSMNKQMKDLLETTNLDSLSKGERRIVDEATGYFASLEDNVLAEVTRMAFCACAFRLAANRDEVRKNPTPELFKQALDDTIKLLQKSVDDDF